MLALSCIILTLRLLRQAFPCSSGVLDDDAGDTLVNVNIIDDERVEKNLKNLRDAKAGGYNPYDEEIDPLTGDLTRKGANLQFEIAL